MRRDLAPLRIEAEPGGGRGEADAAGESGPARLDRPSLPETAAMPPIPGTPTGHRHSWWARFIVLGPLAVAALATVFEAEPHVLAPFWLATLAWTALASLAGALLHGLRDGDWSAFRGHRVPGDAGELDEWAAGTGRYAWLGEVEDRLRDDDRPR